MILRLRHGITMFPLWCLLALWPLLVGFGPPSLVESDDVQMPVRRSELRQLTSGRAPALTAQASLVMDMASGNVVFQRDANKRMAPASITKMMTAVVALEQGNLSDEVTITDADLVEGSAMGIQRGDKLTLEDLLWGLLLPSGNDAAQAIARHIGGGSVQHFVDLMNQKAQALKLDGTRYANAHGLDQSDHYSTAYDLAALARYALRDPFFAKAVREKEHALQASRPFRFSNTNQLLFTDQVHGITGVKTGYTDLAGDSLVASVDRNGRQLIVVVLGTNNRSSAASSLINYAYDFFAWVTPALPWSISFSNSPSSSVREIMVPKWQQNYVKYSLEIARQAVQPSLEPLGVMIYYLAGREMVRLPLYPPRP